MWSKGDAISVDLTEHLYEVSRGAAHAVFKNWQSDDSDELLWAAVSVGLAAETAIKFALASVNPVLLADRSSKHGTFLLLAGIADGATTPHAISTIGATEASLRVRGLPNVSIKPSECEQVFAVRNSAAHMGLVTRPDLILAAKNMTSIIANLLRAMDKSPADFWGGYELLAIDMLNEKSTALQQRIESKKLAATQRFAQLKLTVDLPQLENLLTTLETTTHFKLEGLEVVGQICPVCNRLGYMQRDVDEDDGTDGGYVVDTRPSRFRFRFAYPRRFNCPVCQLTFDEDECSQVEQFEQEVEVEPDEWTAEDAEEFENERFQAAWERYN